MSSILDRVGVSPRRRMRRGGYAALAATLLVVVGLAACGSSLSSQASSAKQAADALAAGLQAQTQGKTQEAIDDYNKVLQHDSKNKYAYYNLGVIDQQAGRNNSAEKNYRTALQIDPQFEPPLFNLAILRTPASPPEAESLYRQVIAVQPDNAAAHLNLGFLLRSLNRNDEAASEFSKAVSLDPQLASRVPPSPSPSPKR